MSKSNRATITALTIALRESQDIGHIKQAMIEEDREKISAKQVEIECLKSRESQLVNEVHSLQSQRDIRSVQHVADLDRVRASGAAEVDRVKLAAKQADAARQKEINEALDDVAELLSQLSAAKAVIIDWQTAYAWMDNDKPTDQSIPTLGVNRTVNGRGAVTLTDIKSGEVIAANADEKTQELVLADRRRVLLHKLVNGGECDDE